MELFDQTIPYLITPILGMLKNYIKYKQINGYTFCRTPLLYLLINIVFQRNTLWKTLIYERWFFFIYKIILSIYRNDYQTRKEKYIKKYNINYNE